MIKNLFIYFYQFCDCLLKLNKLLYSIILFTGGDKLDLEEKTPYLKIITSTPKKLSIFKNSFNNPYIFAPDYVNL